MTIADDLSIQLYSLRNYGDLEKQLAALADLGFSRVETVGRHLEDAAGARALLDRYGMSVPTGHVTLADLRTRFDWAVESAKTLGIGELYMPAVPPEHRKGEPAAFWHALGASLGDFAEKMEAAGLKLGYHNHDWELAPYDDGTTPLQHLLAGAKGSKMTLEVDAAWLQRGGTDPLAFIAEHASIITAVHVKDLAAPGEKADEDGWADIGDGIMDWPALWRASMAAGHPLMILEHDKPSDPLRFARESRAYLLKTMG